MSEVNRLAELLDRWVELLRAGKKTAPEELCRDCPEMLDSLKHAIASTDTALPPTDDHFTRSFGERTTHAPESDAATAPVTEFPGHEILGELGRGGMGVVYKARQLKLNRIVALKMVLAGGHAGSAALVRFLAEAEAVAALQHPNIVQIFESGTHDGLPYFTLEFVEGGSLADLVREHPLPPNDAAKIVEQIARGVHFAHERGIVHRDLKPDNVLLSFSRAGSASDPSEHSDFNPLGSRALPARLNDVIPKVTDFGLAKRIEGGDMTRTGAIMGTPSYMAPEQAAGRTREVGPLADVWALGAILYRLLTGRPPFQAASAMETVMQVIHNEPVPPRQLQPQLPRDLETIVLKCLQKESSKRYASAAAFADDLQRYLKHEPILARPVGRIERGVKWVRRNPVPTIAATLVSLSLLTGTLVSYAKYREAKKSQAAEADRVKERDDALAKEAARIKERDDALAKEAARIKERDAALEQANRREQDLNHQLGIGNFLLANAAHENHDVSLARERLDKVPREHRKFEWHYLARQARGGIFTLKGHTDFVSSVAFSPDGTRLVTGSYDNTAKVWDARTGTPLLVLKGHTEGVKSVAFSPDGTRLVTGSVDNTAKVWDARTGTPLLELKGHTHWVESVAFSPDGTRLVTGSYDNTAKVWDARDGTPLLELKGHTGQVYSVAFSPDGTRLVTGSYDSTAKVWDARDGTPLLVLKGHTNVVSSVAFSPDGTRLVTGSEDNTAKVWDARDGTPLLVLKGHTFPVTSVAFSPDGTRLVTGGGDNTAKVWDARGGQELVNKQGFNVDEFQYRLFWTSPKIDRHREELAQARRSKDPFAAAFHLDRLLAYVPAERDALFAERAKMTVNDLVAARQQRLAPRLQAEKWLAEGKPGPALPLLHVSMIRRQFNQPPVEEFLIAECLLALNQPDEATRYFRAAVDWLDHAQVPMRIADAVALGFSGPWPTLAKLPPAGDPRYNEFDWESWHECVTVRTRVEAKLRR